MEVDTVTKTEDKLRPMTCLLGQLSRPDGDVTLTMGDTCATVSVYGPGEVKMNKELLDKATIEVIYRPKSGLPGCAEKFVERIIRNTCETSILAQLHPRSIVSITVQEIQNSGAYLACCINAACLALLDASVSMKFLMAAVSCIIDEDGQVILDPSRKQENSAAASLTFVFENHDNGVITVSAKGIYSVEQFNTCQSLCKEAAFHVFEFYRESVKKKLCKALELTKASHSDTTDITN